MGLAANALGSYKRRAPSTFVLLLSFYLKTPAAHHSGTGIMSAANEGNINDREAAQNWQSKKSQYPNLDGEHPPCDDDPVTPLWR